MTGSYESTPSSLLGAALQEEQTLQQMLFDVAGDGIAIHELDSRDRPGAFVKANPAICRLLGYSAEEMRQRSPLDILVDQDRPKMEEDCRTVARDGRLRHRKTLLCKDGRSLPAEIVSRRFTWDRRSMVLSIIREAGDHEQTRRDVEQRNDFARTIVNSLPGGAAFILDRDLRYVLAGGEALAVVGFTPGDLEGKTIWQALDSETAEAYAPFLRRGLEGETFELEHESHGRYFVSRGVPVYDPAGRVTHVLAMSHDITHRKQATEALGRERELLQRVFDTLPVLLVMWEPHLQRFTLNRWAEHTLGWTTADANEGQWMSRIYPDPDLRTEVAAFMTSLDSSWREFPVTTKDGRQIPVEWTNVGLTDDTMIGIGVDLRERKKAEAELRRLNETLEHRVAERTGEVQEQADQLRALASQLARAEQRERRRLSRVLHDHLQQLIVAARMKLGCMQVGDGRQKQQDVVQAIDESLAEALSVTRNLAIDLSPPALHEGGLAEGLNWLTRRMAQQHQFTVHLQADASCEPASEETRCLLFECVRELLFNVVKHAGVGEAWVALTRDDLGRVVVTVADEGEGFSPEAIPRRRTVRSGFGLYNIQQRLAHAGGQMHLESRPSQGTTITLIAPPERD
jgi:PAS domain S-box-containing protein